MGTNYYLKFDPCPHCGRPDGELHIGKSSYGWCFAVHVYPERSINTLEDWKGLWSKPNCQIRDEYGDVIPVSEMESIITERSHPCKVAKVTDDPQWFEMNYAEPGPKNLVRHKLGASCVRHGEGTYDYVEGEFS